MLARYTPSHVRRNSPALDGTLVAHAQLIFDICPNESVRLVLGQALADLQSKMGISAPNTAWSNLWIENSPSRPYLFKMYCALK